MGPRSKPAGQTEGRKKRARRGKRRTAIVNDAHGSDDEGSASSSSSSSSSAGSDREGNAYVEENVRPQSAKGLAPVKTDAERRREQALKAIASDSDDDNSSSSGSSSKESKTKMPEEQHGQDGTRQKRHRKRARASKIGKSDIATPGQSTNTDTAAPTAPSQDAIDVAKRLKLPDVDESAGDKMAAALAYVRSYLIDRASWKFQKAKQEYLIRHMMVREAGSERTELAQTEDGTDGQVAEDGATAQAGWPEPWTVCVAAYLRTIQGAAKTRLVQKLQTVAQHPEPVLPLPEAPQALQQTGEASPAAALGQAAPEAGSATAAATSSVRFGDVAMSADREMREAAMGDKAQQDRAAHAAAVFARRRARILLEHLGEPIWA